MSRANFNNKLGEHNRTLSEKVNSFFDQTVDEVVGPRRWSQVPPRKLKPMNVDVSLSREIQKMQTPDNMSNTYGFDCIVRCIDHIHVCTDASKDTKGKVGSAFCVPQFNVEQYARLTDKMQLK